MKKDLKKYIFPIVCVLIVIFTFVLLFDMKRKVAKMSNQVDTNSTMVENVIDNANTVDSEENVVEENTVTNEIANTVANTVTNTTASQSEVTSGDDDKYAESKQKQALELVKQHWGADNSIYCTNESVTSNGEYIVAVREKASTEVKNYFRVNIEKGTVQIEY